MGGEVGTGKALEILYCIGQVKYRPVPFRAWPALTESRPDLRAQNLVLSPSQVKAAWINTCFLFFPSRLYSAESCFWLQHWQMVKLICLVPWETGATHVLCLWGTVPSMTAWKVEHAGNAISPYKGWKLVRFKLQRTRQEKYSIFQLCTGDETQSTSSKCYIGVWSSESWNTTRHWSKGPPSSPTIIRLQSRSLKLLANGNFSLAQLKVATSFFLQPGFRFHSGKVGGILTTCYE